MAKPARGHRAAEVVLTRPAGLLNWAPPQEDSWDIPGLERGTTRSFPSCTCTCCSPRLLLPGDTTVLQVTSRDRALQQCSCTAGLWHWGALPPGSDKKKEVLCCPPLCFVPQTLYYIATQSDSYVEGGGEEQWEWHKSRRGGGVPQQHSTQRGPHHPAPSHPPFSFSFSHTHKEVNIWFKKKKKKQAE